MQFRGTFSYNEQMFIVPLPVCLSYQGSSVSVLPHLFLCMCWLWWLWLSQALCSEESALPSSSHCYCSYYHIQHWTRSVSTSDYSHTHTHACIRVSHRNRKLKYDMRVNKHTHTHQQEATNSLLTSISLILHLKVPPPLTTQTPTLASTDVQCTLNLKFFLICC